MEQILHSLDDRPCTCTLHDIGYNCRRALTPNCLHREVSELVRVAFTPDGVKQHSRCPLEVLAGSHWTQT